MRSFDILNESSEKSAACDDSKLGPAMTKSDIINELRQIIANETQVDRSRISESSRLFHDFGIAGDDIGDILQVIVGRWGTDFAKFEGPKYSPTESEIGNPFRMIASLFSENTSNYAPLTVGRLADAILIGKWED